MTEISVEDLSRRRAAGEPLVLLDVREPDEIAIASVHGATCMPMAEVPARLSELDRDRPIAVMCHHGGRSAKVAAYLIAQGFTEVLNVEGGIDAYAERVDPAIPAY